MKVVVSLSDPWDMGEALGRDTILASVIHRAANAWLLEVIEPFIYEDVEYRFIVVSPRHAGKSLAGSVSQDVPCNMIRTTPERAMAADPCDVSWWRGGGAMIGAIRAAE